MLAQGDAESARLASDLAVDDDPSLATDGARLAVLRRTGGAQLALEAIDEALAAAPSDPVLLRERGDALVALGEDAAAVDSYLGAAKRLPEARVRAVRAARRAEGAEGARRVARHFELLGTHDPDVGMELATALAEAGDAPGCLDVLRTYRIPDAGEGAALLRSCQELQRPSPGGAPE
jgi:tetratricopeptide (TPR) repeat protein